MDITSASDLNHFSMEAIKQYGAWIVGVACVVIIIGGAALLHKQNSSDSDYTTDTATSTNATTTSNTAMHSSSTQADASTDPTVISSGETVTVSDQTAGPTVQIDSVQAQKSEWVAIKDTSARILGAGRFDKSATNVSVDLLRATIPGQTYQAVIYLDDGDHQFDFHKDMLVTGSDGAPVSSTFTAQ